MNRTDLQAIAELRAREAQALLDAGLVDGAYYLLGYAVECALKACIAKRIREHDFPDKRLVLDSHTHDLEKLMKVAALDGQLTQAFARQPVLQLNWNTAERWSEEARYRHGTTEATVREFFTAILDKENGVLPWLTMWW